VNNDSPIYENNTLLNRDINIGNYKLPELAINKLIQESKRTTISLNTIGNKAIAKINEHNYKYYIEDNVIYLRKDNEINSSDNPQGHDIKIMFRENEVENMSLLAVL
jgi:hypothetical protein